MRVRWQREGDEAAVRYLVDDRPVGSGDAGFDRVLELVDASDGPVTIAIGELSAGGESVEAGLPFAARLPELQERLGGRRLDYDLF
jgi:hypothetical protein